MGVEIQVQISGNGSDEYTICFFFCKSLQIDFTDDKFYNFILQLENIFGAELSFIHPAPKLLSLLRGNHMRMQAYPVFGRLNIACKNILYTKDGCYCRYIGC